MIADMSRLQQTTDPMERQKLLAEHWDLMRQNMQSMHAFGGPMMRGLGIGPGGAEPSPGRGPEIMGGPGMMSRNPGGRGPGMTQEQRDEFFQRRLDAMQLMMDQVIQRQQLQQSPTK